MNMTTARFDVLGIGNAIVDVLAPADDAFIDREGLIKGSMALIDAAQAEALYGRMNAGVEASGGSAANTMAGIASLGITVAREMKRYGVTCNTINPRARTRMTVNTFGADRLTAGEADLHAD